MHYAKVVKTGFEVVNFDKLILHQFSTKISKIFNDGVKTSKYLTKLSVLQMLRIKSGDNSKKPVGYKWLH